MCRAGPSGLRWQRGRRAATEAGRRSREPIQASMLRTGCPILSLVSRLDDQLSYERPWPRLCGKTVTALGGSRLTAFRGRATNTQDQDLERSKSDRKSIRSVGTDYARVAQDFGAGSHRVAHDETLSKKTPKLLNCATRVFVQVRHSACSSHSPWPTAPPASCMASSALPASN